MVRFDAVTHQFVASAVDGTELRRFTLPIISAEYILGYLMGEHPWGVGLTELYIRADPFNVVHTTVLGEFNHFLFFVNLPYVE